jgi:succinyl-CoA synthetase alpha subunit
MLEGLTVLEHDKDTEAIALIGEIGGVGEMEVAEWIKNYHGRTAVPKYAHAPYPGLLRAKAKSVLTVDTRPIVALIAGINTVPRKVMGHAGAFATPWEPDAKSKISALEDAGVTIVNHPAKFGEAISRRLAEARSGHASTYQSDLSRSTTDTARTVSQVRQLHTAANKGFHARPSSSARLALSPFPLVHREPSRRNFSSTHRCRLSIGDEAAFAMLREIDQIQCSPYSGHGDRRLLAIGIDRTWRSPCVVAAPTVEPGQVHRTAKIYPFEFGSKPDSVVNIEELATAMEIGSNKYTLWTLGKLLNALTVAFYQKEAYVVAAHILTRLSEVKVVGTHFAFDPAAFRSGGRVGEIHETLREAEAKSKPATDGDAAEREAERHGIVYLRLPGADATIGTLVNGAGLAMNTVDALAQAHGRAANFLDTGGKATSETVKKSFEMVLQDPRVRVVFVNIFGGLTLGDMIARGIILAFQELSMRVPVVVRIRGTNEAEGQMLIRESGLPIYAFDDFDEAAQKAIELSTAKI